MALTTQQVQTFYIAYLARAGESAGVNAWSAPTFNITEAEAAAAFFNSPEATALYPTARTDVAAYVDAVYNNLFGRAAEPAGKAAWVNYINSGAITIEQVPYVIATGAANEDLQALNGKITVATQYTNQVGANYNTDAARAMLKKITSTDPASYTPEALAADLAEALNNVSPGPTPGDTFMLTTGVDVADGSGSSHDGVADTFKFTNGNEKVVGDAKTLTAGDTLTDTGSGDTDILELSFELTDGMKTIGSKGVSSGATISGIEKLEIKGNNAAGVTFDNTAAITGLTTISFSGDTLGGFKFDGSKKIINGITTIEYTGVTGGSVTIDASKAKATQALTIEGSGVDASVIAGAGNDTITGQGSINAGDGNDTIVLTGAATVNAGKGNDVIDAANNVGVDVTGISIDAGSGDDVITVAAAASIDAGAGNDVIDASKYTGVDAAITIIAGDGDDIITVGGNASVETGSGKDSITTVGGYAGTLTVTDFETGDILNLTGGTGNITVGAAVYEGSTLKVGADATLNLNGSGTIDISKATIAEGATININGGTGANSITGSNQSDIITGGEGADTITGGAGADNIDLTETTPASDTIVFAATATSNGKDIITGFTAGASGDKLDVSEFLGSVKDIKVAEITASSNTATEISSGINVIKLAKSSDTSNDKVKFAAAGSYVVLYDSDASGSAAETEVYFYTTTSTTSVALTSVLTSDNQVATLTGVDAKTLVADNFIGIAP